jgi:FtsH-binding integral membrane protein
MSYQENPYQVFNAYGSAHTAASAEVDVRAAFIRRTYVHLGAAVGVFVALCYLWMNTPVAPAVLRLMGSTPWSWLIVLGAFVLVSYVADKWARSATSPGMQYAGLSLYVLAESVIFIPLLVGALIVELQYGQRVIMPAAVMTVAVFAAMTAIVFITARDFSFLRSTLMIGGFVALGIIVLSALTGGFELGYLFIGAMLVLACGYILYDTSNVLHHYRTDQHVSAALALFASVALLFWYMIQLFMRLRGDD